MEFRQLTLEDKALFQRYLRGQNFRLISYDFNSFYMWRNWDPYTFCVIEDALCVKSGYLGDGTLLFPLADSENAILRATESVIRWYQEHDLFFMMSEIGEDMVAFYERHWPCRFLAEEFRPGFNYVYRQRDLATLPGKLYRGKRNHIRRFLKACPDCRCLPMDCSLIPGCVEELCSWYARQDQNNIDLQQEHQGVLDALIHWEKLDCTGAAIQVKNKVVAFTFGSPLNRDTFGIHAEKADTDIPGIYQAINHVFSRDYCSGFRYINRAEDMGDPGLRQAKMQYHPCHMEKKYFLRLAGC